MIFNRAISQKLSVLLIYLFFFSITYAQTENRTESIGLDLKQSGLDSAHNISLYNNQFFQKDIFFHPLNSFENNISTFSFYDKKGFGNYSFLQNLNTSLLPGMGSYQHFNNSFKIKVNEKTRFNFGFGLVKQNTVFAPFDPNFKLSFYASAEQNISNSLSLYLYGQYVTSPFNKPKEFFDPFLYKNPLFIQTEMGTGLKANFNAVRVDFQIVTVYGATFNRMNPVDSKISINF